MKTKRVEIKIEPKVFDLVKKQCDKEGRTVSEIVRQLLFQYIEDKKNGD